MTLLQDLKRRLSLASLNPRERLLVWLAGMIVALLLVFELAVSPLLEARSQMATSLGNHQKDLQLLQDLGKEYRGLRSAEGGIRERLAARTTGFSLFGYLDLQASKAGVRGKIQSMRPSSQEAEKGLLEESVELKLQGLSLSELVAFLEQVESAPALVFVRRISIQRSSEGSNLDVLLNVMTFHLEEGLQ